MKHLCNIKFSLIKTHHYVWSWLLIRHRYMIMWLVYVISVHCFWVAFCIGPNIGSVFLLCNSNCMQVSVWHVPPWVVQSAATFSYIGPRNHRKSSSGAAIMTSLLFFKFKFYKFIITNKNAMLFWYFWCMVCQDGSLLLIIDFIWIWYCCSMIFKKEKKQTEDGETGLNLRCLINRAHLFCLTVLNFHTQDWMEYIDAKCYPVL